MDFLIGIVCGLGTSILVRLCLANGWKSHIDGSIKARGRHV
jgi:hypothetical protein